MEQSSLAESLKNAIQNEEGSISLETNTPYTDQIIIEESVQKITSKLHENLTSRSLDFETIRNCAEYFRECWQKQ